MTEMHTATFSHEYDAGPSGPARSYWDIRRGQSDVVTLCLHHRHTGCHPDVHANAVCAALDAAFRAGRRSKAAEIRDALGIVQ
jgi:hypothetical protein